MIAELQQMLKVPRYIECFMIKTPMVPLKPNHKTQVLFISLFLIIYFTQLFVITPNQQTKLFAYSITITSLILAVSFIVASVKEPGFLRPGYPFMDVLSKVHPCEMCPECEVLRTPRSKHCAICNRCVERFDHHCPWINNCVGVNNHNSFLVFIVSLLIILGLIVSSSITMLVDECYPNETPDSCPLKELCFGCKFIWLRYILLLLTTLICLFFGVPASILCYVHTKNYYHGQTTNERFAKQGRTNSVISESESLGSVADLREVLHENDTVSEQLVKRN